MSSTFASFGTITVSDVGSNADRVNNSMNSCDRVTQLNF